MLLKRRAARTLGKLIDQLRQLSVQFLDCLENTYGGESGCRFRRQTNSEAVGRGCARASAGVLTGRSGAAGWLLFDSARIA